MKLLKGNMMIEKLKRAHKSLVILFNGAFLFAFQAFEYAHSYMPELQQYLPDNIYKIVGVVVVVANILLRFKTNTSLDAK